MKKCSKCQQNKNLEEFNKNSSKKDGLNNQCKDCNKESCKNYYNANRESEKKRISSKSNSIRIRNRNFILNLLKNSSCKDCNNSDYRVLEFDHLPIFKKDNNISSLIHSSHSLEKIKEEINKCEIVCANCHRIRTINRDKKNYRK